MASRRIDWPQAWRVIASRYPPINLFERLTADAAVWDALIALEQLTNPRVRDEVGQIALVPPDERVSGPGASYVMAAFTHLNPNGSRFSDGSFGVYYAAAALWRPRSPRRCSISRRSRATAAIRRAARISGCSSAPWQPTSRMSRRCRTRRGTRSLIRDSYAASQTYARQLRAAGANGVAYPSVRHDGGHCLGAFRPRAVGIPHQERHLKYRWNGERVDRYFDYARDAWIGL